jgi:hypothetical protein
LNFGRTLLHLPIYNISGQGFNCISASRREEEPTSWQVGIGKMETGCQLIDDGAERSPMSWLKVEIPGATVVDSTVVTMVSSASAPSSG